MSLLWRVIRTTGFKLLVLITELFLVQELNWEQSLRHMCLSLWFTDAHTRQLWATATMNNSAFHRYCSQPTKAVMFQWHGSHGESQLKMRGRQGGTVSSEEHLYLILPWCLVLTWPSWRTPDNKESPCRDVLILFLSPLFLSPQLCGDSSRLCRVSQAELWPWGMWRRVLLPLSPAVAPQPDVRSGPAPASPPHLERPRCLHAVRLQWRTRRRWDSQLPLFFVTFLLFF